MISYSEDKVLGAMTNLKARYAKDYPVIYKKLADEIDKVLNERIRPSIVPLPHLRSNILGPTWVEPPSLRAALSEGHGHGPTGDTANGGPVYPTDMK